MIWKVKKKNPWYLFALVQLSDQKLLLLSTKKVVFWKMQLRIEKRKLWNKSVSSKRWKVKKKKLWYLFALFQPSDQKLLLSTTFFAILKSLYLIQRTNTIFRTEDRNIGSLFFVKQIHMRSNQGQVRQNEIPWGPFWFNRKKLVHLSSIVLACFHSKLFKTQTKRKSKETANFKYSWSQGWQDLVWKWNKSSLSSVNC